MGIAIGERDRAKDEASSDQSEGIDPGDRDVPGGSTSSEDEVADAHPAAYRLLLQCILHSCAR